MSIPKPKKSPSTHEANEATLRDALAHWQGVYKSPDPTTRAVALTEIQALNLEIEARKPHCWANGSFPGLSVWKAHS